MPNDAKLGLIIGVVLVIAVATMFYQSHPAALPEPVAAEVQAPPARPSAVALPPVRPDRETKGQMTSHIQE